MYKVKVANEHLGSLEFESHRFFNRHIGAARIGKLDKATGWQELTPLYGEVEFPIEWSVVIGEIAHDLRSALEQLVCQLAIISAPGRTYRFCKGKTEFPVYLRGPRSKSKARFKRGKLGYLKRGFAARIDAAQPYHRRNGGRWSPLWLLHELNNTDKHRLIVLVGGYVRGEAVIGPEGTLGGPFRVQVGMPLEHDINIGAVGSEQMDVEVRVMHQVAFGDSCDAVKGLPVIRTLRHISDCVKGIIESFAAEFP